MKYGKIALAIGVASLLGWQVFGSTTKGDYIFLGYNSTSMIYTGKIGDVVDSVFQREQLSLDHRTGDMSVRTVAGSDVIGSSNADTGLVLEAPVTEDSSLSQRVEDTTPAASVTREVERTPLSIKSKPIVSEIPKMQYPSVRHINHKLLRRLEIPAIAVEAFNIDNIAQVNYYSNLSNLKRVVESIGQGVLEYVRRNPSTSQVIIDDGHGIHFFGACAKYDTEVFCEQQFVGNMQIMLENYLSRKGVSTYRINFERTYDSFASVAESVRERLEYFAKIARSIDNENSLYVSLHVGSYSSKKPVYPVVFVQKGGAKEKNSANLADLVGRFGGPIHTAYLEKHSERKVKKRTVTVRKDAPFVSSIRLKVETPAKHVKRPPVRSASDSVDKFIREADYRVLTKAKMPSVLFEGFNLNSPKQLRFFSEKGNSDKLADVYVRGILDYKKRHPELVHVIIDNGHGEYLPGACGKLDGETLCERKFTQKIQGRMVSQLRKYSLQAHPLTYLGRYSSQLSRKRSINQRINHFLAQAHRIGTRTNSLYVSIHVESLPGTKPIYPIAYVKELGIGKGHEVAVAAQPHMANFYSSNFINGRLIVRK